jgi:hypothetical protein
MKCMFLERKVCGLVGSCWCFSCPKELIFRKRTELPFTTGFRTFAECLGYSAKPRKHSAKTLPNVTLGKGHSIANIPAKTSLPSAFCRALGKGFVECHGRHSAKKTSRDGVWGRDGSLPSTLWLALGKDWTFAECL